MACAASTESANHVVTAVEAAESANHLVTAVEAAGALMDRTLTLHPQVALRPEPFGALAYHYDTRRLVFLKHPDVVRVVQALDHHDSVADTLTACDIAPSRFPAFERALSSLIESEMLHDRAG